MNDKMNDIPFDDPEFQISLYLDGDLSESERVDFEKKLASDESLRELLHEYQRSEEMIQSLAADVPEIDTDEFLAEAARLRKNEPSPTSFKLLRLFTPLVAAASIVFAFVWFVGNEQDSARSQYVSSVQFGPPVIQKTSVVEVSFQKTDYTQSGDKRERKSRVLIVTSNTLIESNEAEYIDEPPIF